jgi:hypothetical protein
MALQGFHPPAQLGDLGLHGPGVLELPARSGRSQRPVNHGLQRHQPLRSVDSGDHPRRDLATAVPGTQCGPRDTSGVRGFVEGDPPLFERLAGELGEHVVPIDFPRIFPDPFPHHQARVVPVTVGRGVMITLSRCHRRRPYHLIGD